MQILSRSGFLFIFAVILSSYSYGQQSKIYIGIGGFHSFYQDARFSAVQFTKNTVVPEVGFSRLSDKNYWSVNAMGSVFQYNFPNVDTIEYVALLYNARLSYLRNIQPNLYIGAAWDVLDFSRRSANFLANNADSYKLSSELYLSLLYLWKPKTDWNCELGLDIGTISFVNTMPSFTTNYQQNLVNNGGVSYIETDTRNPYVLKNMDFKPLWDQFNLRTQIGLTYKRRMSLFYTWSLRRFTDNPGYPVTDARHQLSFRINIINHVRTR